MARRIQFSILLLGWLSALTALVVISQHFAGESTRFFGIADDQEQTILFAVPVEVLRYGFVAGQEVSPGELIVEVRQPSLDAELQVIAEKIQALQLGNSESRASMKAQIVQQKADLRATLSELDAKVSELQVRQAAAASFFAGLGSGGESTVAGAGDTALQQQIRSLQVRMNALRRASTSRTDDLAAQLATPQRAIDAQIDELKRRREELQRRHAAMQVRAELAGRVGSILFKEGDTVPPFQPMLTIHGSRPSFVNGYIHESVLNDVAVDQTVWVQSTNSVDAGQWHKGVVQGLGTRIVAFPERLKVNPLAQAWGREVVIYLSDDHALLLGEKVQVKLDPPASLYRDLRARFAALMP